MSCIYRDVSYICDRWIWIEMDGRIWEHTDHRIISDDVNYMQRLAVAYYPAIRGTIRVLSIAAVNPKI
jgi:hypothetical protein